MDKRDEWANEVLNSMAGAKRAEPNPELFAKIQSKLSEGKVVKLIPIRRISWVAAACLCIIANVYVFNTKLKQNTTNETIADNKIVADYKLY